LHTKALQKKIRINALAFVLGFSIVFISFGVLIGLFGSFIGQYRIFLSQFGGVFIILFGLHMLGLFQFAPLQKEYKIKMPSYVQPGNSRSAVLIGSIFALGWTPCVGPVLASVLLLAATKASVLSGMILLSVFSAGLALPLLAIAFAYSASQPFITKYGALSRYVNLLGGVFLLFLGVLLLTNNFSLTVEYGYKLFTFLGIGDLFEFF